MPDDAHGPDRFERVQKVYFGHTDTAGIIFNPKFVEYFQLTFEDYLETKGLSDRSMLEDVGVRLPVVHLDIDFRRPAEPGDVLRIGVGVARIGETSVTFRMEATAEDGTVAARCDQVRVAVDGDFQAVAVPDRLKEAFGEDLLEPEPEG